LGNGATFKELSKAIISRVEIPLPPIDQQKRIAAILDKAEELRRLRRQSIEQLDILSRSIFIEMFGNPVTNEKGWKFTKVSNFVAGFETGKSIVAEDIEDPTSIYHVLKVSAVTSLEYKAEESKAVPNDYIPPKSHFVCNGDLLFGRANTSELIGATAYVFETPQNLLLPDKIWRFIWHKPPQANPLFVWFMFRHPKFRYEVGKRATGTSGSMKNISQEKVLSMTVGLPPLILQQEFAQRIEAIEHLKSQHRESLAQLDKLFASLQHRAFRGEL
jgi:type I restriction enzyme, S subunit